MIEDVFNRVSPKTLLIGIVAIYSLLKITTWINTERKIRALAGHAKKVNTKFPLGPYNVTDQRHYLV